MAPVKNGTLTYSVLFHKNRFEKVTIRYHTSCNVVAEKKVPFLQPFPLDVLVTFMACSTDEFLCGSCGEEVHDHEMGIYCDGNCNQWFHSHCVGLQKDEYETLSSSDAEWECTACVSGLQLFNSISAVDVFHFDF